MNKTIADKIIWKYIDTLSRLESRHINMYQTVTITLLKNYPFLANIISNIKN